MTTIMMMSIFFLVANKHDCAGRLSRYRHPWALSNLDNNHYDSDDNNEEDNIVDSDDSGDKDDNDVSDDNGWAHGEF